MNLRDCVPTFSELYHVEADADQSVEITAGQPERVTRRKDKMLSLREESLQEGGQWFSQE